MFFTTDSGSSNNEVKLIGSSEAIGNTLIREFDMTLVAGVLKFWEDSETPSLTPSEIEFQEQKRMFNEIPPLLLEPYRGQFVASRDGQVVDSDDDFTALARRFFETVGDVPVYINKIGHDDGISIDTPFFD